jgi:hypothetical protein
LNELLKLRSRQLQPSVAEGVPPAMSETPHFGPVDASALPARDRAERYRALATQHLELGKAALVAEARAAHLELAALWTRLATQAEHQISEGRSAEPAATTGAQPSA